MRTCMQKQPLLVQPGRELVICEHAEPLSLAPSPHISPHYPGSTVSLWNQVDLSSPGPSQQNNSLSAHDASTGSFHTLSPLPSQHTQYDSNTLKTKAPYDVEIPDLHTNSFMINCQDRRIPCSATAYAEVAISFHWYGCWTFHSETT